MNDEISIATPAKMINETELFMKYKSSYTSAFIDFSVHAFLMCFSFYSLWYFRNSWLSVFTVPLLGFMNTRTFIVFHDCGHNSYMPNKSLNYIIGSILGFIIFTPVCWSYHHYNHHLTNGNITNKLNHKYNELIFHNLHQYKKMCWLKQNVYKILRHPLFFFTFSPVIYFGVKQRIDVLVYKLGKKYTYPQSTFQILVDTIISNIGIILFVRGLILFDILLLYIFGEIITSSFMFAIFHNHHTFNPSYVVNDELWNMKDSGINGSSFFILPSFLKYIAGGGEYHHIHHMNSKIPIYNLQKYHEEVVSKSNMFDNVVKLSMTDCYNNLWLVLYDEDKKRYITFAEADDEIRKDKDM
jgi:acyl-lipid omega-6 desaturase (Delta-12 desaturase)